MTVIDQVYQEDRAPTPAGHPRILSLANQKGGVGKTTTAINLGTALAAIGERVLIVDLDPQGNASTGLGIDRRSRNCSTYDVLIGEAPLREAVVATAVPRLHIAASTMDLSGLELELGSTPGRAFRLRDAIAALNNNTDAGDRLHLCADRLPAVAQPSHRQCDGGIGRDPGAAAMRVLRARRSVAIAADGGAGALDAQSEPVDPRHRADHVRLAQQFVEPGRRRRPAVHGQPRSTTP